MLGVTGTPGQATPSEAPTWQVPGAITFVHQEFGTPTGPDAMMSIVDSRNLWLNGTYPATNEHGLSGVCQGTHAEMGMQGTTERWYAMLRCAYRECTSGYGDVCSEAYMQR
uniref:Uncharacterized protein n=1 Tax=Haptolina brevifila TaxID=156173 RepID=A0A7S2FVC7_9EUKA|mmetsp:Transcript_20995/g.42592  ORF Transcript_20995/g.42592 Transcript_20995/m.42592 type:complete len:111 (+) Transcript_20995:419-751(+)